VRIPAAVAFGSGHEVGERNKIEVASVAVADDVDNLLLMLMAREVHGRRRVEAKNNRLKIILAKSYTSPIIYINSRGLLDPNATPPCFICFHKPKPQTQKTQKSR